jgi:hypothetical protein
MRIRQQVFSAQVELPCKIFCGPESLLEVAGTAVRIGPANVQLRLRGEVDHWRPTVGEPLRLELLLPASLEHSKARYLSARATVAEVAEQPDGTFWLELRFRKPIFKEGNSQTAPVAINGAAVKWKM